MAAGQRSGRPLSPGPGARHFSARSGVHPGSSHTRASTRIHHTAVKLLLRWVASAVAIGIAVYLLPGALEWDGRIETLFVVALILGLVNAIVRPVIKALACGLIVLTLGLALFVINALMLYLTGFIAAHFGYVFHPRDFVSALIASVVISVATWFLSLLIKDKDDR